MYILFSVLLGLICQPGYGQDDSVPIRIAAASDLKFALDSVIIVFQQRYPLKVQPIYGSSGKLFEQILNGAPFDIYLSADIRYPEELSSKGQTSSEVFSYGVGRLVLWSRKIDTKERGMNALADPAIKKIAIANPRHAPYGQRAQEALSHYGLYEKLTQQLVLGENISQTAQFVTSGAADIGIIALSLALSPAMMRYASSYYLIPENSHQPLIQGGVITKYGSGKSTVNLFVDFLKSETSVAILRKYGFTKP
nr:molybdate ABC transporter substrate-binding protein [Cytophagales bacterium]